MQIAEGIRVVRGPDWKWQDQDGGEGHVGTLVEFAGAADVWGTTAKQSPSPEGTVFVLWDIGSKSNYRMGHQDANDLRVIDNATIGIKHRGVVCCACQGKTRSKPQSGSCSTAEEKISKDLFGIRWSCSVCTSHPCDLCTFCYMNDRHDTSHEFWRTNSPRDGKASGAVLVGKRSVSRKVPLKGIFPGAQVVRGQDWNWKDQDGGSDTKEK